jgi:hypothetical protein
MRHRPDRLIDSGRVAELYALQHAIYREHGCGSRHFRSIPVSETFAGVTIFTGMVEQFELIGHSRARRCYAFGLDLGGGIVRNVALLELPPIETAIKAVQVAVAEGSSPLF